MAFWGCVLKPGQKKAVDVGDSDVLHLSQACLHDPKQGKNYLQVEVSGTTYSIACLEKDRREHDCLDLFFDSTTTSFVCKGTSEIHLMGYIEPSDFHDEESEEESQQKQVLAKPGSPKAAPAALSPKHSPKKSPHAAPQAQESDSDDFGEENEESEEEGLEASEMFEDEEEEEEHFEDEESEEESLPPAKAAGLAKSPKRKAEDAPGSPAKKPKADDSAAELDGFVKKMVAFLKTNGKTNVGQLGSKVPRPAGVPKMKVVFEQHKDKFLVVGDAVSAK